MVGLTFAAIFLLEVLLQLGVYGVDATDSRGGHSARLRDAVYTCPVSCQCTSYEAVDCSRSGIAVFPKVLSSKVLYLYLEENSISEIGNASFQACPSIETLNLRDNNLEDDSISQRALSDLSMLRHLYLADNSFKRIPNQLPTTLVTLSLEGNLISSIDDVTLAQLNMLKNLYLHDNKISDVELNKRAFLRLRSLTEITLTNNLLSNVPRFPHSVEWVYLSGNRISHIRNGVFRRRKSLMALDLKNNNLCDEGVSSHAFSGLSGLQYLDLSMNKLTKVPVRLPRSLKRLHIEKNELDSIPIDALARLKKLEQLLLHGNKLNSTSLSESAFFPLKYLRTLHIYSNQLDEIPRMLPPRLQVLMAMSNKIRNLRRETMVRIKKIRELGLQNNKLSNKGLEKGALRSLCRLKNIDMSRNRLTALPTLPRSVEIVVLSNNRIVRLPHNSITRLKRVRELFLNGNKITKIDANFANLVTLKRLDLSYNLLRHLPGHLPPNLERVALSNNQLFQIRYDAFYSSPLLQDINLNDNKLSPESVDDRAFRALRHLKKVEINWPD